MINVADLTMQLESTLMAAAENIIASLPGIASGLVLLLLGWFAARVVRALTMRMLTLLNLFLERVLSGRTRAVVFFSSRITRLLSGILYWIILFIFVTAALKTAGLTGVATWLERLVDFLPGIVTGGLRIAEGFAA